MEATSIIPCLTYKKPEKAIEWLEEAFGFKAHEVYRENGKVIHAELKLGNTMIMLGEHNGPGPYKKLIIHPNDTEGRSTQSPYVIINNVREHYENAVKKGAKIALDFKVQEYGGESYSCNDPEGHLWNFGSYDPFAEEQSALIEEVRKTEDEWNKYIAVNDVKNMEQLMDNDWCIVGPQGITTKQQFLRSVKSGDLVHTKMAFETKMVKIKGTTATITQLGTSKGRYKDKAFSFFEWSTTIMLKNNGKWKAILTTLIPAEH